MTFALYTNSLSAHQLPLAREIVKRVGIDNFCYIYTGGNLQGGAQEVCVSEPWIVREESKSRVEVEGRIDSPSLESKSKNGKVNPSTLRLGLSTSTNHGLGLQTSTKSWLENCDLLIVGGIRPIDLMERRLAAGKATFYMAERWFKPFLVNVTIQFFNFHSELQLPGWLRLLHPRYFKMAKRFVKLFKSPYYRFLPIGPWSAHDMQLLLRVMGFSRVEVERCREKFVNWGDFVEESKVCHVERRERGEEIKILWVGRMLRLKHVETIIKAVALANKKMNHSTIPNSSFSVPNFSLTLVGDGPEKAFLEKFVSTLQLQLSTSTNSPCSPRSQWLKFLPTVSLTEVRQVMRDHDLYIFSSNGYDGWGAVVPESMTEGMTVLGTYEAGASAALLPESNLFHCGEWKALAKMLIDRTYKPTPLPYDYTPKGAAERLLKEFESLHRTPTPMAYT